MKLFDRIARKETRGRHWGAPMFAYLNTSRRRPVEAIRTLHEAWFQKFPKVAQKDLLARFRSPKDETHLAAFFELYMCELLNCMRMKLQVHPALKSGKSTRPDFPVLDEAGSALCFLEIITAARPQKTIAGNKRFKMLLDSLSKTHSPNFYLDITHDGVPETPVPAASLRKKLEKWLADIDPEERSSLMTSKGFEGMPRYPWKHDGLNLTIVPIPKSVESRGVVEGRAIGSLMPYSMSLVTCATDIKKALTRKANYYGSLDLPLILAINNLTGDFGRHEHNMEALFGQEAVNIRRRADGSSEPRHERLPKGAWRGPNGIRMKRVSAAIIVCGLNSFNVHSRQPIIYHHPCPERSISQETWPLTHYIPADNEMVPLQGMAIAELLSLPPGFPPEDD